MICRRSFAAKANLLAIETALLTRRQQSADHKDKVCQVGDREHRVGSHCLALIEFFLRCLRTPRAVLKLKWNLQVHVPTCRKSTMSAFVIREVQDGCQSEPAIHNSRTKAF